MQPAPTRSRPRRTVVALLCPAALAMLAACGGSGSEIGPNGMLAEAPHVNDVVEGQFYRPEVLRFALTVGADEESTTAAKDPIVQYISEKIGIPIEYTETTSYSGVTEAMRAGRVDFATMGPFNYIIAHQEANAIALAAEPDQDTGVLGYHSLIITNADSNIQSLEDARGASLAFGNQASTSGHLVPRKTFYDWGITDPEAYFGEVVFTGAHDASLVAVTNGQVDVAGVCDRCIEGYFKEGLASPDDIRVLAKSDLIPNSPLTAREDLDPAIRQAITEAYQTLNRDLPEVVQRVDNLDAPPQHMWQPVENSLYDGLRELVDLLEVDLAELAES